MVEIQCNLPNLAGAAPASHTIISSHDHFAMLFDWFVISLKRQPEKLRAFIERNKSSGIDFQHFEAVDGTEVSIFDLMGGKIVAKGAVRYTPGAIGTALSHLA